MASQNDRDSFKWLHFGNWLGPAYAHERAADTRRLKALSEDLARTHDGSGPWDAVIITGDIARMGASEEYNLATEQIGKLIDNLSRLGSVPVVLTVPGIHDFQKLARQEYDWFLELHDMGSLEPQHWNQRSRARDLPRIMKLVFEAYDRWSRGARSMQPKVFKRGVIPGDFATTLSLGTRSVGVAGFNTGLLHLADQSGYPEGPLMERQLQTAFGRDADDWAESHDACLLLTYLSPYSLGPDSRQTFYTEVAPPSRFALHLCSKANPNHPLCLRDGPSLLILAPPFRAEGSGTGYIAGTLSLQTGPEPVSLSPRHYQEGARGKFVPDPSYSHEPLATYQPIVRRTKAPMPSRKTIEVSETKTAATLRVRFLEIHNFRCLERLSIDFQQPSRLPGQWTCLAGINGAGKSSVLQALALVLLGEPLHRELGGQRLARLRRVAEGIRQETMVRAWIQWGASPRYIEVKYGDRHLAKAQPGAVYPQTMLNLWEELRSQVVLAYGATRNLSEFIDSRYSGLSADARRVMTLFDPLTQVTSAEFLLDKHETEKTPLLRLFKPLLRQVFGEDLGVDVRDGRVVFTARDGPVEAIDLPDGFRSSIAWLADLCAAWCEKFPKLADKGGPADIEALVLIDEIDLHLHPSLQRTLVPRLREALPRVQWVVTTHSPLVLSCFDTAEIVALDRDEPGGVRFLDRQILGFTTDQIYEWLMGTTPTSAAMEQELSRNGTPGPHSEEEFVELLMTSPDVSADEARDRARQLRERVERLSR